MSARRQDTDHTPAPPRRLAALLGWLVPDGASGRSALGDLHEEYLSLFQRSGRVRADLWYLGQTLALGLPWALMGMRTVTAGAVRGFGLDLRASYRSLIRTPVLLAVGVLSLALGAGLVTGTATLINAIWFVPLNYPDAERLVDLEDTHPTEVCARCTPGTSFRSFSEWRTDLSSFEQLEATDRFFANVRQGDVVRDLRLSRMTAGMGQLLGLETQLGRLFDETDQYPEAPRTLVLSHRLWTGAFASNPGVIGMEVAVNEVPHTIIGVLAEAARPLHGASAFLPMRAEDMSATYQARQLWVVGRLAEGVALEAAAAEVEAVASAAYGSDPDLAPGWSARAVPLRQTLTAGAAAPEAVLPPLILSLIVLLIASANLAALLLARVSERERELGVRAALGAGRLRIARAGISDALLLATAGGLGGLALAAASRDLVVQQFSADIPAWVSFPIDLRVLAAAMGVILIIALTAGFLPLGRALFLGRADRVVAGALGQSPSSRLRVHDLLLGVQIALGLVLVAGTAGTLRAYAEVSDFDRLGYRWEDVTYIMASPSPSAGSLASAARTLNEGLGDHPAVQAHTYSHALNLASRGGEQGGSPVRLDGSSEPVPHNLVPEHSMAVGPDYFAVTEIPILAGRGIDGTDQTGGTPAAVVSRDAVRSLWPELPVEGALGRTFHIDLGGESQSFTVVGVSAEILNDPNSRSGDTTPRIYTALQHTPDALLKASPSAGLILRVVAGPGAPSLQGWSRWADETLPGTGVSDAYALEDTLRERIQPALITGAILAVLAALVLFLLIIGIYGTVSYRISTCRRELGVRIALGAGARRLVHAILGRLARVVAFAVVAGSAAAWAGDRALSAGGLPVGNTDPLVLVLVAAMILGVAALAISGPVRRALRLDPMASLRVD